MPGLDVSDGFDAEFIDTYKLITRVETVGTDGFASTVDTPTPGVFGVVTAATPDDLQRWPEADISLKSIVIVTQARLNLGRGGAPGGKQYKADVVEWPEGSGDFYQVGFRDDYSRYGEGYTYNIAQATNYILSAVTPNPVDN